MIYAYEDLSFGQFEKLIVLVCQELFGLAVQGFAAGPDGGRDAKFIGRAQRFPSESEPWVGKTIIQAKHTNGFNKDFLEYDFYSPNNQTCIVNEEVPRVKELRSKDELDNYLLVSNRRLTANAESTFRQAIATKCDLPQQSIFLCGIEQLELYLHRYPHIAKLADLDPIDAPLIVESSELAEVVQVLANHGGNLDDLGDDAPVERTSYTEKNCINKMSDEYAEAQKKRFLKYTKEIQRFLSEPQNVDLMEAYEAVVDEFQMNIIAKRKQHQTFDEVMNYLVKMLFARDPILRQRKHKKLTRAMIFYMYWHCDIGKSKHDTTDKTLSS